jgi:hypothetical protein
MLKFNDYVVLQQAIMDVQNELKAAQGNLLDFEECGGAT